MKKQSLEQKLETAIQLLGEIKVELGMRSERRKSGHERPNMPAEGTKARTWGERMMMMPRLRHARIPQESGVITWLIEQGAGDAVRIFDLVRRYPHFLTREGADWVGVGWLEAEKERKAVQAHYDAIAARIAPLFLSMPWTGKVALEKVAKASPGEDAKLVFMALLRIGAVVGPRGEGEGREYRGRDYVEA